MKLVYDALATVRLGAPQVHRNLALFALLSERHREPGYLLLEEALARNLARVMPGGGLAELTFENTCAEKILLVDGDELAGAALGVSILVGAGQRLVVPAFATRFSSGRSFAEQTLEEDRLAKLSAFRAEPRQRGAVFAIDGKPVGLELFDSAATFARHFPRLVQAYAREALATANGKHLCPSEDEVRRFIDAVLGAESQEFAALGEGRDIRLAGARIAGGALALDDRVIHLAAAAPLPQAA